MTDEKLMELYLGSDKGAFDTLYNRHSGLVYGYLLKNTKNEEVARDMTQQAFLKLHLNKEKYNTSQPFLPWFFVIVKNTMIDEFRKKKEFIEYEDTIMTKSEEARLDIDLDSAVQSLNPKYQKVLEMRYIDDLDFDEIAKSLSTTSQNVRKIVSRAVTELKNKFKGVS